jgi:hypothetical protein
LNNALEQSLRLLANTLQLRCQEFPLPKNWDGGSPAVGVGLSVNDALIS